MSSGARRGGRKDLIDSHPLRLIQLLEKMPPTPVYPTSRSYSADAHGHCGGIALEP